MDLLVMSASVLLAASSGQTKVIISGTTTPGFPWKKKREKEVFKDRRNSAIIKVKSHNKHIVKLS